jgi:hypothetical protein
VGMFDFITLQFGSKEKQLVLHAKRVKEKDAQLEDRQASAIWLAHHCTPESIVGLLGRFEMTYEHLMKDAQEKDEVSQLVLHLDNDAVRPLESHLGRCKNFARPLSLYEQITDADHAMQIVVKLLDKEAGSELRPDKKRHLLIKLAEYTHADAVRSALLFLTDFDEGVRYAAAEVLINNTETDRIRDGLLAALGNPDEDSTRFRGRLAEIAASRRWSLQEHGPHLAQATPSGFAVRGDRLVTT